MEPEEVQERAEMIVLAEVQRQFPGCGDNGAGIVTPYELKALAYLRPAKSGPERLRVFFPGGTINRGLIAVNVPGVDPGPPGSQVLLFLEKRGGEWTPVGGPNGIWGMQQLSLPEDERTRAMAAFLANAESFPPQPAAPTVSWAAVAFALPVVVVAALAVRRFRKSR